MHLRIIGVSHVFVILGLLYLFNIQSSFAQTDPQADKILSASEKKYQQIGQLTASFSKVLEIRGSDRKPISVKGKLKIKKDKFRVELSDQTIICNGKVLWSYLPEDKEVTVSRYEADESFSPDRIFKISRRDLRSRFDGVENANGVQADKLTLFPKGKDTDYFKIELWIDKVKYLPAQLMIYNRNGSVVTYLINSMDTQSNLSDSEFSFSASQHPGVDVIDNR